MLVIRIAAEMREVLLLYSFSIREKVRLRGNRNWPHSTSVFTDQLATLYPALRSPSPNPLPNGEGFISTPIKTDQRVFQLQKITV
jgi:hypothetical protein